MTAKSLHPFGSHRFGAMTVAALLLVALLPGAVSAADAVSPATGTAISADTNTVNGTSAYTTIAGPELNGTGGTLAAGTETFTINETAEFEFNPGTGTASTNGAGCGTLAISGTPTVTASSAAVTVTGTSTGTCNVVFAGLQVRPKLAGATPLETTGIDASGIAGAAGGGGTLTTVPGAAVLQFTNSTIGNAAAGADLVPQPTVHSADQFANLRVGDSIALAIKAGTGTAGAVLACTTNPVVTNGSGDAAFAGCDINLAGTGYVLRATTGSSGADSNAFNITAGAATKLAFFGQPSRGTPGGAFATQPVVEIQDATSNRVTGDSTTNVTLALTTNPGAGTLTCTGGLTKQAVNGLATFTNCEINNLGVGYRITATSSPVLTAAVSNLFDVADRLDFTTQPSSSTSAGVVFASQPVVVVHSGASNTAVNDNVTIVTLSLKAGTGVAGAILSCTSGLSKTVVAGVATFAGCSINLVSPPGNPYKIVASATGLTSAESQNVAITAGVASKLGFTATPTAGVAAQAFPIQPVVAIQDAGGSTVTSGTNSTATVTLSLGASAPAGSVLTCTGGLAKAAVAGVAAFAGCSINMAGTYTLVATASNLAVSTTVTSATSASFIVTSVATAITLTTSAPTPPGAHDPVILWGQGMTLGVQFGANGASKSFQLQGTRDGITWTTITTLTTDAAGHASLFYTPVTNLYYRVVFAGTPDLAAANSNQVRTVVRQLAVQRPTYPGSVKSLNRNTSITFTTTVRPSRPELAPAKVSFYFYRQVSGVWQLQTKRDVFIDAAGLAKTTFKFTTAGQWYVRSQANPTPYNANSVLTPLERFSVH